MVNELFPVCCIVTLCVIFVDIDVKLFGCLLMRGFLCVLMGFVVSLIYYADYCVDLDVFGFLGLFVVGCLVWFGLPLLVAFVWFILVCFVVSFVDTTVCFELITCLLLVLMVGGCTLMICLLLTT